MLTECVASCEYLISHEHTPADVKDASRILLAKCQHRQYRKLQRLLSMRQYVDADYIAFDSTFLKIGDRVALWSEGESAQSSGFVSTLG